MPRFCAVKRSVSRSVRSASSGRSSSPAFDSLPRSPGRVPFHLLISADPNLPRIHLTSSTFPNPTAPPPFCMLLRKHLSGAGVVIATLRGIERILSLTLERRDPVGRIQRYTLVAEIMGRHSNLFLIDSRTGILLDALKSVSPGRSLRRPVQRNNPYEPPPAQEKQDPLTIGEEAFLALVNRARKSRRDGTVSSRWLVETFAGISPDVAAFVVEASEEAGLWDAFRDTRDRFLVERFSPAILTVEEGDGGAVWVLPVPEGKGSVSFPSANTAADELYGRSWEARRLETKKKAVRKKVTALLSRKHRIDKKVREDLARGAEADAYQRKGEILLTNLGSVPKGAESIRLKDAFTEEDVDIPLDVKRTPQQNAERYFSRAKKLRRMAVSSEKRLKQIGDESSRLDGLAEKVETAANIESLNEIEARLDKIASPKQPAAPSGEKVLAKGTGKGHKRPSPSQSDGRRAVSGIAGTKKTKKAAEREQTSKPTRRPADVKQESRASEKKKKTAGKDRQREKAAEVKTKRSEAAPKGRKDAQPKEGAKPPAISLQASTRRKKSSDYRCFLLEGGWEILVGKHDRGNDRLLRRVAGAEDIWLHAQGVPGSHVIIHHPERGKEVPLRVLEEAAKLAAFYSKGKGSAKMAVDYTVVKHLRRVKGGRAGQVTYTGQRTILVAPESPDRLRESEPPQETGVIEEASDGPA